MSVNEEPQRDRPQPGEREPGGREPGVREPGDREPGDRERGDREPSAREKGAREKSAREKSARERERDGIHFLSQTGRRLRLNYGPYRVKRVIGEGGMGAIVLEAEDTENERDVAIKIFSPDRRMTHETRRRFIRGARASAGIDHPNVVEIYSTGEEAGRPFFAMELVRGRTLGEMLRDEGRIPPHRAVEICLQAAKGLQAAADQGVIHRDIKPQNILVPVEGQAKITDFGIASIEQEESIFLQPGVIVGTPNYMSPETCQGEPVDHRSDIYSLGITFYETLAGKPPFGGSPVDVMYKHSHKRPKPITRRVPTLHPRVARVLKRMLAKKPSRRYQDYDSLIRDLEDIQRRSLFVTRSRHHPGMVSAIAVGAALGFLGALWAFGLLDDGRDLESGPPPPPPSTAPTEMPLGNWTFGGSPLLVASELPTGEVPEVGAWKIVATQSAAEDPYSVVSTLQMPPKPADDEAGEPAEPGHLLLRVVGDQALTTSDVAFASDWGISTSLEGVDLGKAGTFELRVHASGNGTRPELAPRLAVENGHSVRPTGKLLPPPGEPAQEHSVRFEIAPAPPEGEPESDSGEGKAEAPVYLRLFVAGDVGDSILLERVELFRLVAPAASRDAETEGAPDEPKPESPEPAEGD